MTQRNDRSTFTNRDFVAMVRVELAAAGRPDIIIERSWIDEDEPGYPFLLRVPVGTDLTVPLQAMDGFFHTRTDDDRKWHAVEFAKALINLRSAERMLTKYAKDVRRAANAAVAAARAEGLDILLADVGFKPTYAYHLTHKAWKDAAFHVLAEVTLRHTSFYLRPETSVTWVEEPAEVAKELAGILQDQRERQTRMTELAALGYDPRPARHPRPRRGGDAGARLEEAVPEPDGPAQRPRLLALADHLQRCVHRVDDARGRMLERRTPVVPRRRAHEGPQHLIGKTVGELVRHPVFASRPIVDVFNRHADHVVFDLSDKVMFDADTGRLWREERRLAA